MCRRSMKRIAGKRGGAGGNPRALRSRVLRLIQPDLSSARQADLSNRAPARLYHWRAGDTFGAQRLHLRLEIIAHQVEFVPAVGLGGMKGRLSRRERKDQPAAAGIHRWKTEDIAKKS